MHASFYSLWYLSVFLLSAFPYTQTELLERFGYGSLTFVLVETLKSFMIFVKFAIAGLLKLIIFLVSLLVYVTLVMRTTKNLYLVTVLLFSPSERYLLFPQYSYYCSFL